MEGDRCDHFSAISGMRVLPLHCIPQGFTPLLAVREDFWVQRSWFPPSASIAGLRRAAARPTGKRWPYPFCQHPAAIPGARPALSSAGSSPCLRLHPDGFGQPFSFPKRQCDVKKATRGWLGVAPRQK